MAACSARRCPALKSWSVNEELNAVARLMKWATRPGIGEEMMTITLGLRVRWLPTSGQNAHTIEIEKD